jgi:hypothetical protein
VKTKTNDSGVEEDIFGLGDSVELGVRESNHGDGI